MADLISRAVALQCIKESRDNIDWGQSDDGDAFMHYTGALYRTMASSECVPAVDAIPVEWLKYLQQESLNENDRTMVGAIEAIFIEWHIYVNQLREKNRQKEQEANTDGERKDSDENV